MKPVKQPEPPVNNLPPEPPELEKVKDQLEHWLAEHEQIEREYKRIRNFRLVARRDRLFRKIQLARRWLYEQAEENVDNVPVICGKKLTSPVAVKGPV